MGEYLTDLAKKYTHPVGTDHKTIANTGKSGLTPLTPLNESNRATSAAQRRKREKYESYQRRRCHGFTVRDLVGMEAFAPLWESWRDEGRIAVKRAQRLSPQQIALSQVFPRSVVYKASNTIPLHPMFKRKQWRKELPSHRARFLLPGGRHGHWSAHNDYVWEVLKPCLRLASQYLHNAYTFPWWDSFLSTESWAFVHKDRCPEAFRAVMGKRTDTGLLHIPLKDFNLYRHRSVELHQTLAHHVPKIQFDITSCFVQPFGGIARQHGAYGETDLEEDTQIPVIFLPLEMLEPLFRDDLNAAERNLDIYRVAQIVLHELCHAIFANIKKEEGIELDAFEPYFDAEPLAELGFSMEESVFGGFSRYLTDDFPPTFHTGGGLSCAAIFQQNWFNKANTRYKGPSSAPILSPLPRNWQVKEAYPIPVGYFEDVHHTAFWHHCRRYGGEAMKMGPLTWGTRTLIPPNKSGDDFDEKNTSVVEPVEVADRPRQDFPAVTVEEVLVDEAIEGVEKRRNTRQRRIIRDVHKAALTRYNVMKLEEQEIGKGAIPSWAQPIPTASGTDADDYSDTWSEAELPTPRCHRYQEIRKYLIGNRAQGALFLDTLPPASYMQRGPGYPENVLLDQILKFGGLRITPEEWNVFVQTASEKTEMFIWLPPGGGKGQLYWIEPADPSVPFIPTPIGTCNLIHMTDRYVNEVQKLCRFEAWMDDYCMDWDMDFLTWKLSDQYEVCGGYPEFMNKKENHLVGFIDYWDKRGRNLCWGPNGTARRIVDDWKPLVRCKLSEVIMRYPEGTLPLDLYPKIPNTVKGGDEPPLNIW